jgi:hypothetical protein
MKKYKQWLPGIFLVMALAFVNIQPSRAYASDEGGPQDTNQKKSAPSQTFTPDMLPILLMMLRLI